jgi:hypothetical protein
MKITNNHNLPAPFLALLSRNYYSKGASQYSVTELMSPPKIKRLRERFDEEIVVDATKLIATQLGTFMHGKLETHEIEGYINEERIFHEIDGVTISGAIDLQQVDGGQVTIIDYKFVKAWSVLQHNLGKKSDWTEQLNIYRWLVETVKGAPVKALQICAVLKDFSAYDVGKEGYPEAEAVMLDIPLWDLAKTEAYIRERLDMHREARMAVDFGEELQHCTPEERWMTETTYAVKKEGRKTAIRVFTTMGEALERAEKEKGYVETRAGEAKRCAGDFCQVSQWCSQYQKEKSELSREEGGMVDVAQEQPSSVAAV